jgi:hypothetical protein
METLEFLRSVLPSQGTIVLGLLQKGSEGKRDWFKWKAYPTPVEAARAALFFDENGETVYFGVNAFGDYYTDEATGKSHIRTQENVTHCRSLFDDFDVGEKNNEYDTKEDALADIKRLFTELRLTPTVVDSGGGFHTYIHIDDDYDPQTWVQLSLMKRDITKHLGLKADRAVDKDVARILRPVGVHNRKYGEPRQVRVLKQGKVYTLEKVREVLEAYIRNNNVVPAPTPRQYNKDAANPFAAALGDYAESYPEQVADRCDAIRAFRDDAANLSEPHWWMGIGVLKFCEGGEEKIHEWSSAYAGYSHAETQAKIDEWQAGPTSCEKMDSVVGCKANCRFANNCRFPIQLGVTDEARSVEEETVVAEVVDGAAAAPTIMIEGQNIPYWPQAGYRWNGAMLSRAVQDEDGVTHWRPFCRSFVYPINRIMDSEGTWVIHWRMKDKSGRWREFFMPTLELASTDLMHKTLASHEIFLARTKNARNDMAEFAENLIEKLQEWRIETKTFNKFGWLEDRSGFVIGTKLITVDDEIDVLCSDAVPGDVAKDFGVSGTVEEWVANVDRIYNRPGAEPFQFAICHSMASALVELVGSSNWHGLPLAFTGEGGTGKTTATKIACGFYGNPKYMIRQSGEQGSTLNAAIKRIAVTGAVPLLLDEFSGRTPEELTRTAYALANGRDKERLNSKGGFATTGDEWFKNSFITSNDRLAETISKLPAGYKVEATQLRFFEVALPQGFSDQLFPDIEQSDVEYHMDNLYGAPLRPYIRFIIQNMDWVRRQLVAARSKFNPKDAEDTKERFYRDTIVTALVAGKIAEKLGLVSFDMKTLKQWALDEVKRMRDSRKETNVDISEHLAAFIATLPGRLIITKHFGDGRGKVKEHPMENLRGPAIGRVCTEDKKVYIAAKAVADWCKESGVTTSAMKEELDRSGYLIYDPDGNPSHKVYIGSGTTVPSGQARCYEIKYHKLFDGKALALVQSGDGVVTQRPAEGING